ncbi:hypothetical protein GR11A_00131 [Vibrio phage vB_VcorM_GR11A]|nr:hypothetical protein GR11A_00131 [Vibrio phage vB_VcorM_GR11A]
MATDTQYTSLDDIDENIRGFYQEETRTRPAGYDGDGNPVTEDYTVIVLNDPQEIDWDYMVERRKEGTPSDLMDAFLEAAINWEEFDVNHNGYLTWKDEHATWTTDQPQVQQVIDGVPQFDDDGNPIMVLAPEPVRPVVDLANRREFYTEVHESNTHHGHPAGVIQTETYVWDDDAHQKVFTHSHEVTDMGALVEHICDEIDTLKATKIKEGTFEYSSNTYQMGELIERNAAGLSAMASSILAGNLNSALWEVDNVITLDNQTITLSPTEYLEYASALMSATKSVINQARTHKDAVIQAGVDATTPAAKLAVLDYDFSTGW